MRVSLLLSLFLVPACGMDTSPTTTEPVQQPRLERVGSVGAAAFDRAGYPARIDAPSGAFTLTWEGGLLRHAILESNAQRVEAAFAYNAGRLVEVTAAGRHDQLGYTATGALVTWSRHGEAPMHRVYAYDDLDRLIGIDGTSITYNVDGCPHRATTAGTTLEYVYADDGRLASIADETGVVGIDYNERGLIHQFEASAQVLEYADGEAMGLDLWPGHLFGGTANGYPAHGELFHLDGNCDPALRSQGTILALVLGSL